MAPEPANPYAPSEALAREVPKVRRHVLARLLAIVGSLLAVPLTGTGFYVLGRKRPFIAWTSLNLISRVGLVIASRAVSRWLFISALLCECASYLAILHVAFSRRGASAPGLRRSLVIVVLIVFASYGFKPLEILLARRAGFENPSGWMMPGLLRGDDVALDRRAEVDRGSVVVFRSPRDQGVASIKRVVATAGDTIEVRGGVAFVGGVPLAIAPDGEPCPGVNRTCRLVRETNGGRSYDIILLDDRNAHDFGPTTVPNRAVFVLGDNRDGSLDSRQLGTIPLENIVGTASYISWSSDPKAGFAGIRWSRIGRAVH
ncbi:MAG TPA: signal peptidase I [Polyangia bacterium]|nr:signal peptidase I [Polyangia bacterium]